MSIWTANGGALHERLKELAAEGLFTIEIAILLGLGKEGKNKVIGRCHRTGIKLRKPCSAAPAGSESRIRAGRTRSEKSLTKPFYPCGDPRTEENTIVSYYAGRRTAKRRCRICQDRRLQHLNEARFERTQKRRKGLGI
jgi:hypothetical protein